MITARVPIPHTVVVDEALMKPITCDTAYFGDIAIIMCSWSCIRCPSTISLSFCAASFWNISPRCMRNSPDNVPRRRFGMNIT